MSTNLSRIFAVIFIVLGGVLFFIPDHIAPVCYHTYRQSVAKTMINQIKQEKSMENQDCSTGECETVGEKPMNGEMSKDKPMGGEMSGEKMDNAEESIEGKLKKKQSMPCYHTGNAVKGVAIMIVLMGFVFFLIDNKEIRTGLAISNIALGILPILFIKIIGVCKMAAMSCRTLTTPAICLVSGLYIVLNVFFVIRNRK